MKFINEPIDEEQEKLMQEDGKTANKKNNNINPYENYVSKHFWRVPKNHELIVRSKITGSKVYSVGEGFTVLLPFREAKLVSLAIRNFDYPKQVFEDHDGLDIVFDIAITVRICDSIAYEFKNTDVEAELKQLIDSLMRPLIKKCKYDDLSKTRLTLPSDLRMPPRSRFQEALYEIRHKLDDFAELYGLEVVDFYTKSIQQSETVQEAYNKKVVAEKQAEADLIAKRNQVKLAEEEAKITKIKAQAEAEAEAMRFKAIQETIKGLPVDKQVEILKIFSANLKGNTSMFMSLGNDDAAKVGMISSSVTNNQPKKTK